MTGAVALEGAKPQSSWSLYVIDIVVRNRLKLQLRVNCKRFPEVFFRHLNRPLDWPMPLGTEMRKLAEIDFRFYGNKESLGGPDRMRLGLGIEQARRHSFIFMQVPANLY